MSYMSNKQKYWLKIIINILLFLLGPSIGTFFFAVWRNDYVDSRLFIVISAAVMFILFWGLLHAIYGPHVDDYSHCPHSYPIDDKNNQ